MIDPAQIGVLVIAALIAGTGILVFSISHLIGQIREWRKEFGPR